jgi:hypothetical protein
MFLATSSPSYTRADITCTTAHMSVDNIPATASNNFIRPQRFVLYNLHNITTLTFTSTSWDFTSNRGIHSILQTHVTTALTIMMFG